MIRNKGAVRRAGPNEHAGEHENFFLAKFATRSPCAAPLTTLRGVCALSSREERIEHESRKALQR
jgi:hypothetical protein